MTATNLYDPLAPAYFDHDDARAERDRTFEICTNCRICVRLCPSFKDLFAMIDSRDQEVVNDVDFLTDAEHDQIVDECYQCKLCYVVCPYTPGKEQEWVIDFPRLMLRSLAINQRAGKGSKSARLLARTDLQGKVATALATIVNRSTDVGVVRALMERTTGISKTRLLPTYAPVRFSKWLRRRNRERLEAPGAPRGTVAVFPTCLVEYQDPNIGKALVSVYERNGVGCELPEGLVCCGMPWLDAGDTKKFEEHARRNVAALAPLVREGHAVVVPQPTCAYVLRNEYPDFLGTDDARAVAAATKDASEYLMACHREEPLDVNFSAGQTYATITWQAACHYRAQQIGPKSRDLMALTGAQVTVIERCSAIDGTWGLRAENVEMARKIAKPLMETIKNSDADLVAGDCHLSNTAIREATGKVPSHPLEVLARAYGVTFD